METERDRLHSLSDAFRALATEDAALEASRGVEAALRGEVRSIARARRRRTIVASIAAAAVLALAVAVPWERAPDNARAGQQQSAPANTRVVEAATAFFPLTYSSLPLSNAQLVRVQVPRSALASFGLAPMDVPDGSPPGTASGTMSADVLVGEDGLARAVRFVSP